MHLYLICLQSFAAGLLTGALAWGMGWLVVRARR